MNLSSAKLEQYMAWSVAGARIFSTCSRRQYMAIVLSPDGRVVGTGYNGAPSGFVHCIDGGCPRALENPPHGSPYTSCIALHAEANAIIHSDRTERLGGTLIINGPPCMDCAKLIAGSGVSRLVYMSDPSYVNWAQIRMMLQKSNIQMIEVDRARVAGAGVSGELCGDVGGGAPEEVGVALQSRQSDNVASSCWDGTIVGVTSTVTRYAGGLHKEHLD